MPRRREDMDVRGDLQAEIMAVVWRLGEARVEDVREQQIAPQRSAYTTVQTVMNRLVARGLLERERRGHAFYYRATITEEESLAHALSERLADASPSARRAALLKLVDRLDASEVDEIARYATEIKAAQARAKKPRSG
jgi:BlaI family transcriptional regulator, penicillinase repressor